MSSPRKKGVDGPGRVWPWLAGGRVDGSSMVHLAAWSHKGSVRARGHQRKGVVLCDMILVVGSGAAVSGAGGRLGDALPPCGQVTWHCTSRGMAGVPPTSTVLY